MHSSMSNEMTILGKPLFIMFRFQRAYTTIYPRLSVIIVYVFRKTFCFARISAVTDDLRRF